MTQPHWSRLLPTLLDFERSPGRYRVVLREPHPLFEHIGSVMLLATGRPVEGLPATTANGIAARRAARFFVRTVMLRPGSDPLTLLGLKSDFEPGQLREHYRLMIRLTHPDFETAGERWPADAATRVNLANDLLSSPGHRTDCGAGSSAMASAPMRTWPLLPPALERDQEGADWRSRRTKLALAGSSALFMVGALVLMSPKDNEGSLAVRQALPAQGPESLAGKPATPHRATETSVQEALRP